MRLFVSRLFCWQRKWGNRDTYLDIGGRKERQFASTLFRWQEEKNRRVRDRRVRDRRVRDRRV